MTKTDYKSRVGAEKEELEDKFDKLSSFINTEPYNTLPQEDRDLLVQQHGIMSQYINTLGQRIARFEDAERRQAEADAADKAKAKK